MMLTDEQRIESGNLSDEQRIEAGVASPCSCHSTLCQLDHAYGQCGSLATTTITYDHPDIRWGVCTACARR